MVQNSGDYDKKYEPINYHELVGDLQERVRGLERKLDYGMVRGNFDFLS
jgi:hypothetical protein